MSTNFSGNVVLHDEDAIPKCSDFYTDFLNPLSLDLRYDIISSLHCFNTLGAEPVDILERYTEVLLRIERELGPAHIVCEIVAKQMAESIRKFGLIDEAVALITGRMERIGKDDFGCLLLICRIHSLSGSYRQCANHIKRALRLAEESEDPALLSLALVKQACIFWHLQDRYLAEKNLGLCLDTLTDLETEQRQYSLPFTETTLRIIDIYKTLGYIHRFLGDSSRQTDFYSKALDIVSKDQKALAPRFKLETQIAYEFSLCRNKYQTKKFGLMAYEKIKTLSEDEEYMIHHSLTVIYPLARIAYALQSVENSKFVLSIWEYGYELAEKYCGQSHPQTSRLAADVAFLSNKIKEHETATLYLERTEAALESCESTADLDFLKRYVRELSDSWKLLGKIYMSKKEYDESERCFKQALAVNKRAYGCNHPRLGGLYMCLGYLYKQTKKYFDAGGSFRNCLKINEEFSPDNSEFQQKLKNEIREVNLLDKKMGFHKA